MPHIDRRRIPLALALLLSPVCCSVSAAQAPGTAVRGRVQNPHGPLRIACESCHATTAWRPLRATIEFNHNAQTNYPLRGMHTAADCRSCHVGLVFSNVAANCSSCHADFHRRQMPGECSDCHTVRGWKVAVSNVKDHRNRFPLVGAHAALECESCHTGAAAGRFSGLSTACSSCHMRDYRQARTINHQSSNLPTTCETCHMADTWKGARFDHAVTGFPLTGAHARLDCLSCHRTGTFQRMNADCGSCHEKEFAATTNPNHQAAGFPRNCAFCHATSGWAGAQFNHNTSTKFALTGAHLNLECRQCHASGQFAGLASRCYDCHARQYDGASNPDHKNGRFPTTCETCHNTNRWQGATFDHNLSRFPLTGKHTTVACAQCHVGGRYTGTPADCSGCHMNEFTSAVNPNHQAGGFSTSCQICHTTSQWQGATFDHANTRFPLTGKHTTVQCAQCHVGGKYAGLGAACATCHLAAYNNTNSPNHQAAGFPTTCETCHNTTQWQGATFNHGNTRFPLTGKHTTVQCAQCHTGGKYAGLGVACATCHLAAYNSANNPNHQSAGFPTTCETCHTTTQWQGATFNHSNTRFPLTGKHTAVQCAQCHVGGKYAGLGPACATCHLAAYNGANNPNHQAAGFPTTCETCHNTSQWQGATFNHSNTRFPLTGKHTSVQCAQCHTGGKYAGLGTACATCHLAAYNNTRNPNHQSAGFPQDCALCHSTTQWAGATFNHSATRFPLTGRHTSVQCAQCHAGGKYAGLGTACATCHLAAYNGTTNPNHQAAGFPTACELCHNTTQWPGATFNHSNTSFPLTGKHTTVQCAQCHVSGIYKGTPSDCYSCHKTVYSTVTNPNHAAAGFPTTCQTCHNTTQWSGARFDHTRFPIYSGSHAGKWQSCNDCHNNPSDYAVFSCTNCHEHNKTSMDSKHGGVRNYVYNSINCYSCHPTGRE